MALVVDASVVVSWGLADEEHPTAERAQSRLATDHVWAPSVWWFEVRNTLIVSERRGRVSEAETEGFLSRLGRMPIEIDREPGEAEILRLARAHRLTVYDAAYLELASRRSADLATLDRALAGAARAARVGLV